MRKLPTGILGFDQLALGGLPEGRSTLVAGSAGSGKTLFAMEYLVAGIQRYNEPGVCVTFEEKPRDIIENVESFGWNLQGMVEAGTFRFVDATPSPGEEIVVSGDFDLSGLMARIENAIRSIGAKRVALDSIGALFPQFSDGNIVRRELHRLGAALRQLGVTSVITLERVGENGALGRFGVEEFVADTVVILRNRLELEKRRRTIEILKYRGAAHQKGEYPFTIDPEEGFSIVPLSGILLMQRSSSVRVSSGVAELDRMCGGGMYRDSIILVSGATGTGKTLMVTEYVRAAIQAGERALIIGAEESREQLTRNAAGWGVDFEQAERDGLLQIRCRYPEVMGLEDHLLRIKRDIESFRPQRVAVDSMSAFERVSTPRAFREFVISLTSHIKHMEITGMFTDTASMLGVGQSVTERHFSTVTDTIILLRYVELRGEMRRGVTVLKMRGTWHEKEIREYTIDHEGMKIGEPFRGVHGILTGVPRYTFESDASSDDPERGGTE